MHLNFKISLFQGILIGIFAVGGLIGLFVFATYSNTGGANAIGPVIVWGTLSGDAMHTALTASTGSDQALKNVTYIQKDPSALAGDLASAIATGQAPDLVLASQEELHSLAPFLVPVPLSSVSARTFQSTFVNEGAIYAAPNNGGWYGVPFLVDPLVLFSNDSILSSDGIVAPPSTWEALTGLVPNVAVLTPSRQISRALIALGTYDNVHDARGILSALFAQTGVPIVSAAANGQLSTSLGQTSASGEGVPPGQSVVRFYTQFADPSKVSYTWNQSLPDSQSAFLAGNLALYLGYVSEARFFTEANPNLRYTVSPFPQPATATGKGTYGLAYAFMPVRGAKNPSGAYQVAALMTNAAEQSYSASATGLAPAARSALAAPPANDPVAAVAYASALYAEGWLSPAAGSVDQVFSGMINDVISGRSTLQTALASAERSLAALLQ
jgi:ABC-type glycerol-3-phosphate transport system substrate-binding protein